MRALGPEVLPLGNILIIFVILHTEHAIPPTVQRLLPSYLFGTKELLHIQLEALYTQHFDHLFTTPRIFISQYDCSRDRPHGRQARPRRPEPQDPRRPSP